MKYIDISRAIWPGMPKYPSDPDIKIGPIKSLEHGDSCNLSKLDFGSHTGTHVDAPLHILEKGPGVDELMIEDLICDVLVTNVDEFYEHGAHEAIDLNGVRGVLLKGVENKTTITIEQAEILLKHRMKVVGTEGMSIEESSDKTHSVHRLLLNEGVILVEGLDLTQVKPGCYRLICLPLKIKNGDGAPARAVLAYD